MMNKRYLLILLILTMSAFTIKDIEKLKKIYDAKLIYFDNHKNKRYL